MPEDKTEIPGDNLFPAGENLPERSHRDLIVATVDQLQRDLHPHAFLPVLPPDFTPDDLRNAISEVLRVMMRENPSGLEQALYRIDLSEKKRHEAMAAGLMHLTEAILRREALKVWIRRNYSDKI